MDPQEHARSFGSAAGLYDRVRPSYPTEAIRWVIGGSPRSVVDLGAGTGILTRQLVSLGYPVTAVEPDDKMREQIGGDARAGSAEHIPLADETVDVVVAGQAYHWFPTDAAHAEIARVLRVGGIFGPMWNVRDEEAPWVAALEAILDDRRKDRIDERRLPSDQFGERFAPLERATFRWSRRHTPDSLIELLRSRSHHIVATPREQQRIDTAVRNLAAGHPDLAGRDEFDLPYVTYAYRAAKR